METQTQRREAVETAVVNLSHNTSLPVHSIFGTETATANASAASPAQRGVFYKEGECWTLVVGGRMVRLKEAKGLAYLAYLLRHPGTEFHVLDHAGGIAGRGYGYESHRSAHGLARGDDELERAGIHVGGLGDAGEILDEQAKRPTASAFRYCAKNWKKPGLSEK
jgi:hypothetical protein